LANETLKKQMGEDFQKVAPIAFLYDRDSENSKTVSDALKKFYLNDKALDNSSLPGLAQLYSDAIVGFGVNRAAELLSEKSNHSVYYYRFNYKGRYSHFYLPDSNGTTPFGTLSKSGTVLGDYCTYSRCGPRRRPDLYVLHPEIVPHFQGYGSGDSDREQIYSPAVKFCQVWVLAMSGVIVFLFHFLVPAIQFLRPATSWTAPNGSLTPPKARSI
jgi:hypothetical protein